MLYTKPIGEITFQDVLDFCAQGTKENINLDYKEEINASLVKTITAMANTWGGLILIGVKDDDSAPHLPVEGMEFREHLLEQVNNLILGNITPPVFPEIQVCKSDDGTHAFVVIRVPQSNTTPHAARGNTSVYLRTNTSNEPEELATVDRVLWLVDRRKKTQELRESFYVLADGRFKSLCKKKGIGSIEQGDLTIGIAPLYPFEALIDHRDLKEEWIVSNVVETGWGTRMPLNVHRVAFEPMRDGTYSLVHNSTRSFISYEELNKYGFFYHRENMDNVWSSSGEVDDQQHLIYMNNLMQRLDLFLGAAKKWYEKVGYWGMVELRMSLEGLAGEVRFRDLSAPQGYERYAEDGHAVDERLDFLRELSYTDLVDRRPEIVSSIISEMCWALHLQHITEADVRKLMSEAGRA